MPESTPVRGRPLYTGTPRTRTIAVAAGALAFGVTAWRTGAAARRRSSPFPRLPELDSTRRLLAEGYTFISDSCRRLETDVFETRLLMQPVFCARGEDAARMFYTPGRFTRQGAIPLTTLLPLQDRGSIQTLDGGRHRARKRLFLDLLTARDRIERLSAITVDEWHQSVHRWQRHSSIVFHDEIAQLLCRAACRWAGVPLADAEVAARTHAFVEMVEGAGRVGPRTWRALRRRRETERWLRSVVGAVRDGRLDAAPGSVLHAIASYRERSGELLNVRTAVVELINVLRPIVAVARYATFAALALHQHRPARLRLQGHSEEYLHGFAQEVRRFYPFFPAVGGVARTAFEWRGHRFDQGTWVVLDVYGTNHDPRLWPRPEQFSPERFTRWDGDPFTLIPQGGGDASETHRCPGEDITLGLIKTLTRQLVRLSYDVPRQNLTIDLRRVPALPASGFVIANVERRRAKRLAGAPANVHTGVSG